MNDDIKSIEKYSKLKFKTQFKIVSVQMPGDLGNKESLSSSLFSQKDVSLEFIGNSYFCKRLIIFASGNTCSFFDAKIFLHFNSGAQCLPR